MNQLGGIVEYISVISPVYAEQTVEAASSPRSLAATIMKRLSRAPRRQVDARAFRRL
ncbi:MAG TPA: hypothetical protein VMV33_02055 [Rhodocyclaceae bacterium]|nr:hypothetical protein [Rhodocyclaceae bacterium]